MLDPQVVVNLLPELGVGVDLVSHDYPLAETFASGVGRLVEFMLSVSAFCSETNEFHKPVPVGLIAPNSPGTRTILTRHLEEPPRFGRLAAAMCGKVGSDPQSLYQRNWSLMGTKRPEFY